MYMRASITFPKHRGLVLRQASMSPAERRISKQNGAPYSSAQAFRIYFVDVISHGLLERRAFLGRPSQIGNARHNCTLVGTLAGPPNHQGLALPTMLPRLVRS